MIKTGSKMTMDEVIKANSEVRPEVEQAKASHSPIPTEGLATKSGGPSTPAKTTEEARFAKQLSEDQLKYKSSVQEITKDPDEIYADIMTTEGTISIKLSHKMAPKTVKNFVELAEGTKKNGFLTKAGLENKRFFDGLLIFRVVKDYFIQM